MAEASTTLTAIAVVAEDGRGLRGGCQSHAELAVDHDAVLALAVTTGLTVYDASYLWLARTLDAELVTLDQKLAKVDLDIRK